MREIIMLVSAFAGTVGFAILFYVKPSRLPLVTLGGLVSCGVYLIFTRFIEGEFVPNLVAAFVAAIYAQICARIMRSPVTVYTLTASVPLVPGSSLYQTMAAIVSGNYGAAGTYGMTALTVSLAIAAGIAAGSIVGSLPFMRDKPSGTPGQTDGRPRKPRRKRRSL